MKIEEIINGLITISSAVRTNEISDGYHTFGELYEHRIVLFIALCGVLVHTQSPWPVWKSKKHADGTEMEGWFIMGIHKEAGQQISYHLPNRFWDKCEFVETLETAPEWDGHTSDDVLNRLQ